MKKFAIAAAFPAGIIALPSASMAEGNLAVPPAETITLAITGANATLSATSIELETGKYYRLTVTSDGGAEVLFTAADLFNNAWINQLVAAGVEIKMWGDTFKAVEVGEGGPMEFQVTFVVVKPGEFAFTVAGDAPVPEGNGGVFVVH
jgi:hypothetical protein